MDADQDHARLIAERVARRVTGTHSGATVSSSSTHSPKNGAPVREELSAIREGLHDLESKLDRIESKIVQGSNQPNEQSRARVIDFVSSGPPLRSSPTIEAPPQVSEKPMQPSVSESRSHFVPPTQSPWLAPMSSMYGETYAGIEEKSPQSAIPNPQVVSHPSQERFGVEEATVTELVEFFENEKKCSVDPSGKPCDHCAMCSSRGF